MKFCQLTNPEVWFQSIDGILPLAQFKMTKEENLGASSWLKTNKIGC
jgi:hypothetical protein